MAKFVYSMQNILNIKLNLETQAKSAYGLASARVREEEEKLEELVKEKRRLEDVYRQASIGKLVVRDLIDCKKAVDFQKEEIKVQIVNLRVAQKNLEIARKRLNEAMQERKTHEKLKEHEFEDFLAELADQEKKEIDELVSYRYGQM